MKGGAQAAGNGGTRRVDGEGVEETEERRALLRLSIEARHTAI
jgi:hypothetical protein